MEVGCLGPVGFGVGFVCMQTGEKSSLRLRRSSVGFAHSLFAVKVCRFLLALWGGTGPAQSNCGLRSPEPPHRRQGHFDSFPLDVSGRTTLPANGI